MNDNKKRGLEKSLFEEIISGKNPKKYLDLKELKYKVLVFICNRGFGKEEYIVCVEIINEVHKRLKILYTPKRVLQG